MSAVESGHCCEQCLEYTAQQVAKP